MHDLRVRLYVICLKNPTIFCIYYMYIKVNVCLFFFYIIAFSLNKILLIISIILYEF